MHLPFQAVSSRRNSAGIAHRRGIPDRRRVASLLIFAALTALPTASGATVLKEEDQSFFSTVEDDGGAVRHIQSSLLYRLLKNRATTDWQNLGIMIHANKAGEFAAGNRLLIGKLSVATASDRANDATIGTSKAAKVKDKDGLKIGNDFYYGFGAQYIRKLEADKGNATYRELFDAAAANTHKPEQKPDYNDNPDSAGDFKIRGGTNKNISILFANTRGKPEFTAVADRMYDALKGAGYTDAEIDYLKDKTVGGIVDRRATEGGLESALDALGNVIANNKNTTNANLFVFAPGGFKKFTVAYRDATPNQAGGGAIVSTIEPGIRMFAADPVLIAGLKEDLPKSGGGFWLDDPSTDRTERPFIEFTTLGETFSTAMRDVTVLLNGTSAGTVQMGNSAGADYVIEIPDSVLDGILPDIEKNGFIDIGFALPSAADSFQLAVTEDFDSPGFAHRGYGISIGFAQISAEVIPAPGSALLLILGLGLMTLMWLIGDGLTFSSTHRLQGR